MSATTKCALLLLDYQRALCESGDQCLAPPLAEQVDERGVLDVASRVLEHARSTDDVFVIHVRLAFDPSYDLRTNRTGRFQKYVDNRLLQVDDPASQIVDLLAPLETEPVVVKGGVNPFIGTSLLEMLLGNGIRKVVLGGVATNLVVESAARHASDSGLTATVVEDMCASFSPQMHSIGIEHTLPMFAEIVTADDWLNAAS